MSTTEIEHITTDDIFGDLGFPRAEAENLRIRSEMMGALTDAIRRKKLTQEAAAKWLKVSQPRVSNLMRGRIDLFSIDYLVKLLASAGLRVELQVKRAA